jgi:cysteine-S-conjugate beta-lyase
MPDAAALHLPSASAAAATQTLLVHGGRDPGRFAGMVNTPVHRGSTILSRSMSEWESRKEPDNAMASYGRFGTPTTRAFEGFVAELEGGHRSMAFPSGLSACTHSMLAFLRHGDHVLVTDSVYGPTRSFACGLLARMGITTTFFDPAIGAGIRELIRPNTRVVFLESPGSWTFEIQDVPAIAEQAHRAGAVVIMDSTWATPLFFKPLAHGVDVSIHSATKYIIGHSDALLGVATATAQAWQVLAAGGHDFGQTAGPDDLYLAMRGLRTLDVRMRQHWANGVRLAESLIGQPLVERVLHPALPGDAGHALWRRDYTGASGLFGVVLGTSDRRVIGGLIDRLQLFGIGLSWGGFESLVLPCEPEIKRSVRPCPYNGRLLRIHAGLEHVEDLVADLRQALAHATRS